MGSNGGEDLFDDGQELNLSMSDIYYIFLSELSEISNLVDNARIHNNENHPRRSWATVLKSYKSGCNNPKDVQVLIQKKIMETISKNVVNTKPLGEPLQSSAVPLELRIKLVERLNEDKLSIAQMDSELQQLQNTNKELQRKIEEFQRMNAEQSASKKKGNSLDWQDLQGKVKALRAKYVKDIRYITEKLCPQSDVQEILSAAFKNVFSGQDPYVNVDDKSPEDVEFLLRCSIIVRHPHERHRIRLCDLV